MHLSHIRKLGIDCFMEDSGFLALWLASLIGIIIGLLFVWGSTDVSNAPLLPLQNPH